MADSILSIQETNLISNNSPLRNRSKNSSQNSMDSSMIQENDDVAELTSRRKSMMERRKSLGLGRVAQLPETQLEERMKPCIQLNTENKLNAKNAFKFEIIDIMTCMVKRNSTLTTLQVASSSLDVSSKIYGLRVDKVHTDVMKMLGAMDKQEKEQGENGDGDEEEEGENQTIQELQKKKRKRKGLSVLTKVDALRGNVELTTPGSLMSQNEDPQTSDMLYQTVLPLSTQDLYYMMCPVPAIDQPNSSNPEKEINLPNPILKFDVENFAISPAFSNFCFRKWTIDEDEANEEFTNVEQHERSIFQFDMDASLPADSAQFMDDEPEKGTLAKILSTGVKVRTLEYSYVPTHEIIHWAGPSYWKIKLNNKNSEKSAVVNVKTTKKKVLDLEFSDDRIAESKAMLKFSRGTQLTAKTTKQWLEDKLMIADDVMSNYDSTLLSKYRLRPESNIRIVQNNDLNTTHLKDDNDGITYDYNNALDTSEYCPNVQSDNDEAQEAIDDWGNDMGKLAGNNLVEMPDLVDGIYIPYSKRAKKIDVRQLKKSIWRTITKDTLEKDKNKSEKEKKVDAKRSFSEIYDELPKLLTKNNLEALSVPVCFVSLLHLANEKMLLIQANKDLSNLNVATD